MIEKLYIQNYRCLDNLTLEFSGRPTALIIGKNGTGKSTILEAMRIIQLICRRAGRVGKLVSANDFTGNHTERPLRFEIEVALEGRRYKYELGFDWPEGFREARIFDEALSVDGHSVFKRQLAKVQVAGKEAFGLDWHVFALPIINERQEERNIESLKQFGASMILTDPLPTKMTGFSAEASTELEPDASNFASCLRGLLERKPAAYGEFDAQVKAAIPDFSSIENVTRGETGKQLIVHFQRANSREQLTVEFESLSAGEKCIFLSSYLVATNATSSPVVCIWDEPDNHLALSEVGQFITGLRRMTQRRGQFIATTHHPETVRKFSDETTFVLTRKSHLDPVVPKLLSEFAYSGDLIHALIRDEIIG
jgi:predicted ATPase